MRVEFLWIFLVELHGQCNLSPDYPQVSLRLDTGILQLGQNIAKRQAQR